MRYTYQATIEKTEDGFLVKFPCFDGFVGHEDTTLKKAIDGASEALMLAIADAVDDGRKLPRQLAGNAETAFVSVDVGEEFILESKCMTQAEAANVLGVSASRVSQMASSGVLEGVTIGKRSMVTVASVNERVRSGAKVGRPLKQAKTS